jgi:hypothetical protein
MFKGHYFGTFFLILMMASTPAAKAAVSTTSGMLIKSLDGEWQSAPDLKDQGTTQKWFDPALFPTSAAKTIQVPGSVTEIWPASTWTKDAAKDVIWYLKTFSADVKPQANMRYYLRFGAVMQNCEVWLNGADLGSHVGNEDPFEFDVTKLLLIGKPNTVAVRASLWEAAPIALGGINQHVSIVVQPEVRIIDAFARPDAKAGQIRLDVTMENNTASPAQIDVNVALGEFKPARSLGSQGTTVTVPPGQTVTNIVLPVKQPHVWDLNDPFLYTLAVTSNWKPADGASVLHDTYSFRTGFRDFRVVDGYFYLNGRRIFLKSLHGNWYDPVAIQGTSRDMTWLGKDFPELKKAGFNMMRFLVSAALPEQLDQADELGFLIYSEHQTSWLIHSPAEFGTTVNQIVRRDRNHPSIAMWGLLNETDNLDIYHKAKDWLPSLRAVDDTRPVMLSSGRWDKDSRTASISNVGSSTWDVYLGGEDAVNPKPTGQLRDQLDAYKDGMGDNHDYPYFPVSWNFITDFAKLDQDTHPFLVSEGGIGSLYNAFEEKRQMEKAHAPAWSPSWAWINAGVDGAAKTWAAYGLNATYPNMEDAFIDSQLATARQRELFFTIVRSNPKANGYSLTSNQDFWGASEGVMNNFFDFKPGHLKVLQDGWAPLRWCLLVNPMHVYADQPIHIKATLANEDTLPGGDYPTTLEIKGPIGIAWKQAVTAHVQQNGPLAYILFDDDIHVPNLKAGAYMLEATLDGKPNATSDKLAFTVSSRASLPPISGQITVTGLRSNMKDLLTQQGAKLHDYAPNEAIDRETILVGPDFKGKATDWRALYARAARGAHVVFLCGPIFHDGGTRNKWLALPAKGDQSNDPDWLYHKEVIAKVNQPAFAGLPTKLMTAEYYGVLLARSFFFHDMTSPAPADTAAASIYNAFGGAPYRDGLMLATYPFHAGHFTINAFNITDSMGSPATDRLLLNLVIQAQADAAPLAPLPADYDAEMDKLVFKD